LRAGFAAHELAWQRAPVLRVVDRAAFFSCGNSGGEGETSDRLAFAPHARAELHSAERQFALFFVALLGQVSKDDRRGDATDGIVSRMDMVFVHRNPPWVVVE